MISVLPLGVGRGADGVVLGQCSSSYIVIHDSQPILLFDVGFGVMRQYLKHFASTKCPIYVSHNHSDHAAELPVIGALAKAQGFKQTLYAATTVLTKLKNHRLNELESTGSPLSDYFEFHEIKDRDEAHSLGKFTIEAVQGRHSEHSFGLLLSYKEKPILSLSSDSGFHEETYERLAVAPIVILDGREKGSKEHASFLDIEEWAAKRPDISVWVSGYGNTSYKPKSFTFVQPHQKIKVSE